MVNMKRAFSRSIAALLILGCVGLLLCSYCGYKQATVPYPVVFKETLNGGHSGTFVVSPMPDRIEINLRLPDGQSPRSFGTTDKYLRSHFHFEFDGQASDVQSDATPHDDQPMIMIFFWQFASNTDKPVAVTWKYDGDVPLPAASQLELSPAFAIQSSKVVRGVYSLGTIFYAASGVALILMGLIKWWFVIRRARANAPPATLH